MSRDTPCSARVDDHWAGRREDLERFMNAAYCRGVFDDSDYDYEDGTIESNTDDQDFPWVLILNDGSDSYATEAEALAVLKQHRIERGLDPETGERPSRDRTLEEFNEYGLCFDYVTPHTFRDQDEGYWRYQLSWGGPGDEIRFYGHYIDDYNCVVYRAEYWFLDWHDGAHKHVTNDAVVRWVWSQFDDTGTAGHQYKEAMKDYEPPDDDLDPDFEESSND